MERTEIALIHYLTFDLSCPDSLTYFGLRLYYIILEKHYLSWSVIFYTSDGCICVYYQTVMYVGVLVVVIVVIDIYCRHY